MKIFSAKQLYEADKKTTENQEISSTELMERAGTQIFNWIHDKLKGAQVPVHIFCGIGNNGGDGLVVARLMIENGYNVKTYIVNYSDKRSKDFLRNYDKIKDVTKKWPTLMTSENDFPEINPEDIIIDAMFGIGCNRPPKGWVKKLIQYLNAEKAFTLSIDMPSGLYADEAQQDMEAIITADHTLTFGAPKLSFFLPETGRFAPYFEVLDIGLDPEYMVTTEPIAQLITKPDAQKMYRSRKKWDYKNTFGHTLIVAGSYGKIGAAILSSSAAFKIGAGLVTAFVPKCGYEILQTALPEAMVITDEEENIITNISYTISPTAIAVGMGIGQDAKTVSALEKLLSEEKNPILIDADGLNCISENKSLLKVLPEDTVLTPHEGELKRLVGEWKNDYEKIEKAKAFSKKHKIVLLIKGANTISIYDGKLYINTTGNVGMAKAGSGDVLSGVIAGLMGQGYDPLLASVFGVYLHGLAGDLATENEAYESSMASDIVDNLGNAYLALFQQDNMSKEE